MGSLNTDTVTKLVVYYAIEVMTYKKQKKIKEMIFCSGLLHGHLLSLLLQSIDIKKICVEACKSTNQNYKIIKIIMAAYEDVKNQNDQILGAMLIYDAFQ